MGQIASTPTDSFDSTKRVQYQDFVKNYLFVRNIKDPRYGDISLLQDKSTKQYVALREITLKNSMDLERDTAALQARSKISHPNIIKILGYTSKSEDLFYTSAHKILVIMEYLENDLEKEILRRKSKNEFYEEEQLWHIIENIVKALLEFQKKGIVHDDIKPGSVLVSKMGVYKIIQPNVKSGASPNTSRLIDDTKPYRSPILMNNLRKNGVKLDHNPWKSDVFSLGMTLLHVATLNSCDKFYDRTSNTINMSQVEQTLSALKMIYTERLQNVLRMMLTVQEDKRPDFIELAKLVSPSLVVAKTMQQQPQQSKQAKQALKVTFRVLEAPEKTKGTKPKENDSYKQEKRSKIGTPMKTVLQENNLNASAKGKDNREDRLKGVVQPMFYSEQKPAKTSTKTLEGRSLIPRDRPQNEIPMLRIMTEPSHPPFLNKTYTKEKSNITQEFNSTSPLHTLNFRTEGDDYDPALGKEFFSALTFRNENTSPGLPLNSPRSKEPVTSQYKSMISNEVAKLMVDFEAKRERARSPVDASRTQNASRIQKENLEISSESNNFQSPNSKLLQSIVDEGSIKRAGSPIQFDKSIYDNSTQRSPNHTLLSDVKPALANSSSTNHLQLQREQILQNPYFPGAPVSPVTQPRTIQTSTVDSKSNGFYMSGNYLTPQNKPKQVLLSSQSALNLIEQRPQENTMTSFDSNNNYSINKTYNLHNMDANLSNSEQASHQMINSRSDPYLLFNNPIGQQATERPYGFSDSYDTIQPKESVKSTSSTSSAQLRSYPNPDEVITEKFSDGSVYKGQKKSGLRHGKGTYHHSDGSMYTGDWFRGLMHGQGTLHYSGGSKAYQGQWRDDKFDGTGIVFNEFPVRLSTDFDFRNFDNVGEFWVQYEGDFFSDQKQGTGVLFLTNGERYQGQFREDLVEGVGVFYTRSGKAFKGEWYKNRLIRPL